MGAFLVTALVAVSLPQDPARRQDRAPGLPDSGLVIAGTRKPGIGGYGLGDGGVHPAGDAVLEIHGKGRCTTPGGVLVECRREGTKLTFPSGRELLCASDGYLHLRDGSAAGPFPGGVELRLGDGTRVAFALSGSRRAPIAEVTVAAGSSAVRLWRRRAPGRDRVRPVTWGGERLMCLGDGGALYRVLELGPVATLERVLAPKNTGPELARHRLALLPEPLLVSVTSLIEEHGRHVSPEVDELRQFARHRAEILPQQGPHPVRVGTDPLRFRLRRGYELEFDAEGSDLRMRLRRSTAPAFAEWQLGYRARVRCVEASRGRGRSVAVPALGKGLAAREEHHELGRALAVFRAMRGR